jgi:hypothetical protein
VTSAYVVVTWIDWSVVVLVVVASIAAGVAVVRLSSRHGALSYFASDRNLPWWAIAISNTATYQSGSGAFVMLLLAYGLAANWLWWSSWIIWMPLVAIIWAPLWASLATDANRDYRRTDFAAIWRATGERRAKSLRGGLLLWLQCLADRLHHESIGVPN